MPCINCSCDKCNKFNEEKKLNRKILYNEKGEKLCSKCNVYRNVNEYHTNGKKNNGETKKRGECHNCRKEANKKAYLKRKEKLKNSQ